MSKTTVESYRTSVEEMDAFNKALQAAIEAAPSRELQLELATIKLRLNRAFYEAQRGA